MAGNAWEWVNDWYAGSYARCGNDCLGLDPKGPCAGADPCKGVRRKIVKGGSWWWPWEDARGARRRPHVPINKPYHHFGFRCARDTPATVRQTPPAGEPRATKRLQK
jgi:formylglycine-generating enzyme required for sulfatase activity